ncbi:hypothetical protein [Pseudoalteromonas tunicata]|nr:hypothetical protein [Pseudoalteromonas tunicata]MDP4985606.1 hypothetical protein [Pseudoalteromonas tunicata]MDP5214592.1 hypothetical protein [Pseudoalteromonas tunicata]
MKTLLMLFTFITLNIFSFSAFSSEEQDANPLRRQCCTDPSRICEIQRMQDSVSIDQMFAAAKPMILSTPIYVGGARYTLTKSDFNPVYTTRVIYDPCFMSEPRVINILVGYEVVFPVDGDYGQNLFFDINGRSNKSMSLTASCGTFSASDSGSKFIISQRKNTGGSCKNMQLKFTFPTNSAPASIDLTVTISEQL